MNWNELENGLLKVGSIKNVNHKKQWDFSLFPLKIFS